MEGTHIGILDRVMDLKMDTPLRAVLSASDEAVDASLVWLDIGRAHALASRRLRVGSEWSLTVTEGGHDTTLPVRILAVRVRTEIKQGPRVLHLCSLAVPPEDLGLLEALLRRVNPTVAPPERPTAPDPPEPQQVESARKLDTGAILEETRAETERARRRQEERQRRQEERQRVREKARRSSNPHRSRRRLPPQRRLSSHIPKNAVGTENQRERPVFESRNTGRKGVRTAELIRPEFHHGDPPVVVATFASTDLFRRSTRSGTGWIQVTLADLDEVPDGQDMALELILPTGTQVHTVVQVARRGRGRMILESRELSKGARDAIRLVS